MGGFYRLGNPFVLRSVEPAIDAAIGEAVTDLRRVGKRWSLTASRFISTTWLRPSTRTGIAETRQLAYALLRLTIRN